MGTGVCGKFSVCLFLSAYSLLCVCADVQCTGCHCFVFQPAPGPLGLTWERRAAHHCTAAHCDKARTRKAIDYNSFLNCVCNVLYIYVFRHQMC